MKAFINSSEFPPVAEAVIEQSGGWESFTESALDVSRYGANSGCNTNFIYYSETVSFFEANRREILGLLSAQSRDFGTNIVDMVFGFSCLSGIDKKDIESILFGLEPLFDPCSETQVKNALAWFALETVCFDYANFIDA